jgi:hypothetical protein
MTDDLQHGASKTEKRAHKNRLRRVESTPTPAVDYHKRKPGEQTQK